MVTVIDEKFIRSIDHLHKYKEYCAVGEYRKALKHLNHIKDDIEGMYNLTLAMIEEKEHNDKIN